MKKYNTYKEFQDYSYFLDKKNRECTLTETDELDYIDINNIKKELKEIRNSQKDLFWEAIIASLMEIIS